MFVTKKITNAGRLYEELSLQFFWKSKTVLKKETLGKEMQSHGPSFLPQPVTDSRFPGPGPRLNCDSAPLPLGTSPCEYWLTGRVAVLALPPPSPPALLMDLIFLHFQQHWAAATGNYLAASHAVVQHTGEK